PEQLVMTAGPQSDKIQKSHASAKPCCTRLMSQAGACFELSVCDRAVAFVAGLPGNRKQCSNCRI
ncbi:hypothetical protein LJC48_06020, partial [Desulfovibrio sp. OttesenSCG-928-C06]|nr:hypothetical protein [Desulfovibrio sp. OttesenSCG-928-C06]